MTNTNAASEKVFCDFCKGTGLNILPLRYAVLGSDNAQALAELPVLQSHLGENVVDVALESGKTKYVVRPIRRGYIYILLKKQPGVHQWMGYAATDDGYLSNFNPVGELPLANPTFSCDPKDHGLKASMIRIPEAETVQQAWLFFSPSPLTFEKLTSLENAPDPKVMQAFSPADWINKQNRAQKHSLTPDQLDEQVAEMYVPDKFAEMFYKAFIPTYRGMFSSIGKGNVSAFIEKDKAHLNNLQAHLAREDGAAFVLHDPIGITQELNDFRNDAFAEYELWRKSKEVSPAEKKMVRPVNVTNEHKLQVLAQIEAMRDAMIEGAQKNLDKAHDDRIRKARKKTDDQNEVTRILVGPKDSDYFIRGNEMQYEDAVSKIEHERRRNPGNPHKIWNKFKNDLDIEYMADFRKRHDALHEKSEKEGALRSKDHLAWIKSSQLFNAYSLYDKSDAFSGLLFVNQVDVMLVGFNRTGDGDNLLGNWINNVDDTDKNYSFRSMSYNQTAIETAAKEAMKAELALDGKDFVEKDSVEYIAAKLNSVFRAVAKETDRVIKLIQEPGIDKLTGKRETARIPKLNSEWIRRHPFICHGISITAATTGKAASYSMTKVGEKISRAWLGLAASTLGGNSDELKNMRANLKAERLTRIDAAVHRYKNFTTIADGEILRVRLAGFIFFLEGINIFFKAQGYGKTDYRVAEISAATIAFLAAGAEWFSNTFRVMSRADAATVEQQLLRDAARVNYGAVKSFVAVSAISVGLLGVFLNYMAATEASKKGRDTTAMLLYAQCGLQGLLGVASFATSYADTEAFFAALAKRSASAAPKGAAIFRGFARGAAALTLWKSCIYRIAALAGWIGLLLTLGMIAYDLIKDNELEDWCQRSCFRKYGVWFGDAATKGFYPDAKTELEEMQKAITLFVGDMSSSGAPKSNDVSG
jgi:hypothetical protein